MFLAHGVLEGVPHTGFSLVSVFCYFCVRVWMLFLKRGAKVEERREGRERTCVCFSILFSNSCFHPPSSPSSSTTIVSSPLLNDTPSSTRTSTCNSIVSIVGRPITSGHGTLDNNTNNNNSHSNSSLWLFGYVYVIL